MVHLISERLAVLFFGNRKQSLIDIYTYGIEIILSSLVETVVLILIGIFLKEIFETFLFIVFFSLLRVLTGGYHASTFLKCVFITAAVLLLTLLIYEILYTCYFELLLLIDLINCFVLLFLILFWGPIENKNKKTENKVDKKIMASSIVCVENFLFITLYFLLDFKESLVVIPTQFFVGFLMILELIRKAGEKNETHNL